MILNPQILKIVCQLNIFIYMVHCYLWISPSSVVKIGMITHMLRVQDYFLDWKKHSCPQRAYNRKWYISSHRQSHKTTESEDMHANEGRQKRTYKQWMLVSWHFFFCFGHELVWGEAEVNWKKQWEENCWIQKGGFGQSLRFFVAERRCNNSTRHVYVWGLGSCHW